MMFWYLLIMSMKYQPLAPQYQDAANHAYDAAAKQSGTEDFIGKANAYASDQGKDTLNTLGVSPDYAGAAYFGYKTVKKRSIDTPGVKLPTDCKLTLHADENNGSNASAGLSWHF